MAALRVQCQCNRIWLTRGCLPSLPPLLGGPQSAAAESGEAASLQDRVRSRAIQEGST
jgi:hypothetical protein